MPTIEVKNLKNEVIGEVNLSDEVFGAPLNEALIYDALKNYLKKHSSFNAEQRGAVIAV